MNKATMLDVTKTQLGKLLASEDIRIEHRQVQGPFFDVKHRVLVLPIWKDMDADLYDLMIGHEVGHALFTPADGWEDKVRGNKKFKSFLNIVEDVRIEKKMKRLYPGLRKPMYNGYTQLLDRGFFGVKLEEMKHLPFADRLNVYAKLGVRSEVSFSDTEQNFLTRVENAETFEEMIVLASELMKMSDDERERMTDMFEDVDFDSEDEDIREAMSDILSDGMPTPADEGEGEQDNNSQGTKSGEENSESNNSGNSENNSQQDTPQITTKYNPSTLGTPGGSQISQQLSDALQSFMNDGAPVTEETLREKQRDLIDENAYPITYLKMPKLRLKDWVVPADKVHSLMKFDQNAENLRESLYTEFMQTNKAYISYLVKEFELRRNAKQFAKVRVSKTGELDLDKVWSYKFSENLFLQSAVVPQGKNHGMLMMIDMSSSMNDIISGTIEQTIAMAMFCRKVNIPFEVYAFNDNGNATAEFANTGVSVDSLAIHSRNDTTPGSLMINNAGFRLQQYLHSGMSLTQFNRAVKNLLIVARIYKNYSYRYYSGASTFMTVPPVVQMSGTPLNEAVLVLRTVADEFKRKTRVEIVNTLILTDGDASYGLTYKDPADGTMRNVGGYSTPRCVVEDHISNHKVFINRISLTQGLLEMYQKVTGSRVIGIYLMAGNNHKSQITHMCYKYNSNSESIDFKYDTEFKKHKFFAIKPRGYDVFYMVPGEELEIKNTTMDTVLRRSDKGPTKNELLKAFKKMQNTKQVSRVFLNQFVQYVS